jgi:hypothetical protein
MNEYTITLYDDDGVPVLESNKDSKFAAKSVQVGKNIKYYVMTNVDGSLRKPRDAAYLMSSYRMAKISGLEAFKVIQCPQGNFESYIRFLETNNEMYLRAAQTGLK